MFKRASQKIAGLIICTALAGCGTGSKILDHVKPDYNDAPTVKKLDSLVTNDKLVKFLALKYDTHAAEVEKFLGGREIMKSIYGVDPDDLSEKDKAVSEWGFQILYNGAKAQVNPKQWYFSKE